LLVVLESFNANGVASFSPGLRGTRNPGKLYRIPTPTGLRRIRVRDATTNDTALRFRQWFKQLCTDAPG